MKKRAAIALTAALCVMLSGIGVGAAAAETVNVEYTADFGAAPAGDTIIKSAAAVKWFETDEAVWYGSKQNGHEWNVAGVASTERTNTAKIITWPGGEADLRLKPKTGEYFFNKLNSVRAAITVSYAGSERGGFAEVRCMASKTSAYVAFGAETDTRRLYYSIDGEKSYIGGADTVFKGDTVWVELSADRGGIDYVIDGICGRVLLNDKPKRDMNTEYPLVLRCGLGDAKQVLFSDISVNYTLVRQPNMGSLPFSAIMGDSGIRLEKRGIIGTDNTLQSHFSTTGGNDEWIKDKDGKNIGLKYTFGSQNTTDDAVLGKGKKGEASDASFGVTDENFLYSELEFEIKAEGVEPGDISINLGFTPKSDEWTDYRYYGRRLYRPVILEDYAKDISEWQKVTIPLRDFSAERTAKYCIPGTDTWTYERVDWSKLNLIHINLTSKAAKKVLYIKNVSFGCAEFTDCIAECAITDENMKIVESLADARGKYVGCIIKMSNSKSFAEKAIPILTAYKDGKMIYAESAEVGVQAGTEQILRFGAFYVPKNTDGFALKLMLLGQNGEVYGDEYFVK